MNRPGDGVTLFALFVWVTLAVGPWWVGVGILACGTALNVLHERKMGRR